MNIPVIYINRNNLGASQFKHPKIEIIIWKKKWVKITHSCKWLIQSLFVTKEQTIIEILITRKKKLLHKLNLYILPTRYIKQKNKMQNYNRREGWGHLNIGARYERNKLRTQSVLCHKSLIRVSAQMCPSGIFLQLTLLSLYVSLPLSSYNSFSWSHSISFLHPPLRKLPSHFRISISSAFCRLQ